MRNLLILLTFAIWLLSICSYAQSSQASVGSPIELVSPRGDTLSALLFSTKRGFAAKSQNRHSHIYIGWSTYWINGKHIFYPIGIKPYTLANSDPEISELYRQYLGNRKLYFISVIGGGTLILAGGIAFFADLEENLFAENPDYSLSGGLVLGSLILTAVGVVGLGASLKNARHAVKLYHERYVEDKTGVRLELGTPTFTPTGLALYLRF